MAKVCFYCGIKQAFVNLKHFEHDAFIEWVCTQNKVRVESQCAEFINCLYSELLFFIIENLVSYFIQITNDGTQNICTGCMVTLYKSFEDITNASLSDMQQQVISY